MRNCLVVPKTKEAYQLLHEGILALQKAEMHGVRVDIDYCKKKIVSLNKQRKTLFYQLRSSQLGQGMRKANKKDEINFDSSAQLSKFLYDYKKLDPPHLTEKGSPATDIAALRKLTPKIPELKKLLDARKNKKIIDYLDMFKRETVKGVMRPITNLHIAETFRSSVTAPSFQNIPKRDKEAMQICRAALFPSPGNCFMEKDFSGLEVNIGACYHQDPNMIKYLTTPGADMHGDVAAQIFNIGNFDKNLSWHNFIRKATKNSMIFPQFYGDYYVRCAHNFVDNWFALPCDEKWKRGMGVILVDDYTAADFLLDKKINSFEKFVNVLQKIEDDFWNNRFRVYQQWKDKRVREFEKKGYLEMFTGFRCYGNLRRNQIVNYPIQGAAFHVLLKSFILVSRKLEKRKFKTRLCGQIHDSMLADVAPNEILKFHKMSNNVCSSQIPKIWEWIIVPLSTDTEICPINSSWDTKEHFDETKTIWKKYQKL